jgi:hypothetical protein
VLTDAFPIHERRRAIGLDAAALAVVERAVRYPTLDLGLFGRRASSSENMVVACALTC